MTQPAQIPQEIREIAAKVGIEGHQDERKIAIAAVKDYGTEALKATFLLNGGAIIALLALMGALHGKDTAGAMMLTKALGKGLAPAFQFFIFGVAGAALTLGIGYLNWTAVASSYWEPGHRATWSATGETRSDQDKRRLGPWRRWFVDRREIIIEASRFIAVILFLGSLFCFLRGAWIVARAYQKAFL